MLKMTRKIGAQTMERSTRVVHRFYVIQFLESPNVDIEEYVCVPDSWVILVLLDGLDGCPERRRRRVKVAYPSGESRETTSDRVQREEDPWYEWYLYRADVTYITDSYDLARAWIRFNGLSLLSALEYVDTANTEEMDSTSSSGASGCSLPSSPSSSDESNLRMQLPSIKINPSVAGSSDDVSDLSSTADDFNPIKAASITEENSNQIIDEISYDNNQTCQNHHSKITANSDDIVGYGYATLTVNQEIPNASNQSCRYERSGKNLLSSVIEREQDGMNNSMIDRVAAPRGHLHSSSSPSLPSSSVDQNHLAQEITENRQSTRENYFNGQNEHFPLLESSKRGPFYSVHWKKQLQERVSKYISDGRSYSTGNNVKGTPLTAKSALISTKQSHLPLPLPNGIMNSRNKENVSLENQRQVIQDGIPNNKKDEGIDKKKYSQNMRNKTRRSSDFNNAFKYYVVQFKDLPDPKMRIDNYVCVLNSWITSGLVDDVPDINFEVKVAYPADAREMPLDFQKFPVDPLKEWKSYRAVVKHITGAYYDARYWIDKKMGISDAPGNNDAMDMGDYRPTAALYNSSGSSGGSSPNLPSSDLRKLEVAVARCLSQPGLTVTKICKRPATSGIVDNKKRPKRLEESTAVYNLSSNADRKSKKPIQSTQNRSYLGGQSELIKAYESITQSITSILRTNLQQIPPQTHADTNLRELYQSVINNIFAARNIYSTDKLPGHEHMWPNGSG